MLLSGMRRVHQECQLSLTLGATIETLRIGTILLVIGCTLLPIEDIVCANLYDRQTALCQLCRQ